MPVLRGLRRATRDEILRHTMQTLHHCTRQMVTVSLAAFVTQWSHHLEAAWVSYEAPSMCMLQEKQCTGGLFLIHARHETDRALMGLQGYHLPPQHAVLMHCFYVLFYLHAERAALPCQHACAMRCLRPCWRPEPRPVLLRVTPPWGRMSHRDTLAGRSTQKWCLAALLKI
jgi:hypothetical protein